jgi:thiol-disulfide isomerase/thioredoxin
MRIIRTLGVTTFALLAAALLSGADKPKQPAGPQSLEGKAAPTFTLATIQGKDMSLEKEKGNVVVLDFWATWCPPCRESLPHLQKFHEDKDLAAKGLKVFAVNLKEDKDTAKSYVDQNKLTFPVPLDKVGGVAKKYMVSGIPTTVVVGRDGKVAKAFVGFGQGSEEKMREAIEKALDAEKPAGSAGAKPTEKPAAE